MINYKTIATIHYPPQDEGIEKFKEEIICSALFQKYTPEGICDFMKGFIEVSEDDRKKYMKKSDEEW